MGLANEMKSLSEEVLSSFKNRVKENEDLVVNVGKKMQEFRKDQENTAKKLNANAVALKQNIAVGEKDRLNNYNQLMGSIQKDIKSIEKDVKNSKSATNVLMSDFSKTRKIMSSDLDKFLANENKNRANNEQSRLADYELFIGKISDEVSSIFNYTNEMLERFSNEHKEMSAELRKELTDSWNERFEYTHALLKSIQGRIAEISNENLNAARKLRKDLDNGDALRLKEYNAMFDRISSEVTDLRNSTTSLLDNYSKDRSKGAEHWKKMQEAIASIRGSIGEPTIKKSEKVVAVVEIKAEPVPAPPKVEPVLPVEIVEEPKLNEESSLEDKILNYINSHSQGVKVSDMEEPLHETRMKIGFAAKCLLDAGKVSKVENLYYPIKKTFH
jgi:hypothetical protein